MFQNQLKTFKKNPGQCYHFGLINQIMKLNSLDIEIDEIVLDIGIDGLPLNPLMLIAFYTTF